MRSSAADRARPTLWDGAVVLLLLLAAGAVLLFALPRESGPLTAVVVLDGREVARYALDDVEAPTVIEVPGAPYPISLELQPGRIRVAHSDCPSQDCVRTGWASRAGAQIVCLPNRLVVSLSGGGAPAYDAVSG
ncbi:NusG domain II-containing protein [uncultured Intestinimonas sp.]|uniref:NusG domain II-containing protein n=1 Tax=uncultured Intestinimonas sp. TaxID=1689265 RepID=UPI0025FEFA61|nr:NusG domain II-containing protein [uncultured Intestinimonas sp.]